MREHMFDDAADSPLYGVSDNAIRKWVRWYEHGREVGSEAEGGDGPMADAG